MTARCLLAPLILLLLSGFANAETRVRIDASKPGPTIDKNVYGQFAEHLGRGIYGGLWVGEGSTIPNTRGLRNDVLGALKDLRVPLVRWPGGCFADQYHWRDGIGPRSLRKKTVNASWGGVVDDNAFGTHEFFDFVEQLGADAYVSINVGTGSPREMAEWVEYMTSDAKGAMANLRRANGRAKPWRVRYLGEGGRPAFSTANEIVVPVGSPIAVSVTAADVIHSFWIPNFGGKIDMIPGRLNRLNFTAERPGIYRGVCAEFCGDQHARMAFDVVALEPAAFEAWRENQAKPAPEPDLPLLVRGRELFRAGGCGSCHVVRGTEADGRFGPDLTHVGSRRTIGAGQFPNNVGTLAGWIANTQHIKPGVRMPSYGSFTGEDLRALAGYLESLK